MKIARYHIIFYVLLAYVFLQFSWWTYLMFEQNKALYEMKIAASNDDTQKLFLTEKLKKRQWMVLGEGTVFLLLLLIGAFQTLKIFGKEVELAGRQKNFLLSVTHELKSPLASIKLYLQTLRKHTLPEQKKTEITESALIETERLINLTDKILLAARIDNDSYLLHIEEVNLSDLITKTIRRKTDEGIADVQIVMEIEKNVTAQVDVLAFNSIVLNLFENARKYSAFGSEVVIRLKTEHNKVLFSVADSGNGIPAVEKEKIFEKFYRIGNEDTRNNKGTGLGLFIVKYLVNKHGGDIMIRDNIPSGSIFEVKL